MRSTRSAARRVTLDAGEVFCGSDEEDLMYECGEEERGSSKSRVPKRRTGISDALQASIKEPPRATRLRRAGSSYDGGKYREVDSDEDLVVDGEERRYSSRGGSRKKAVHEEEVGVYEMAGNNNRPTRGRKNELLAHVADKNEEVDDRSSKRRRVTMSENMTKDHDEEEEDDDEIVEEEVEEDARSRRYSSRSRGGVPRDALLKKMGGGGVEEEEEEESEEEHAGGQSSRKYSFRNREATRLVKMNIESTSGRQYERSKEEQISYHIKEEVKPYRPHAFYSRVPIYRDPPALRLPPAARTGGHKKHHRRSHRSDDRRHYDSSSESSGGGDSSFKDRSRRGAYAGDDDANFSQYEQDRLQRERDSVQPMDIGQLGGGGGSGSGQGQGMGGSVRDKASQRDLLRADVAPVAVDPRLGFQSVGGLEKHIQALKEMVVLPLLYPEVFERFDTQPPRGVLFVGPPGTGKTLTARALANSLSINAAQGGRKVTFFMRKGADCLSKWVGEGERQLRLLFEQAKRYQPSIIFFDELDGLAPG